MSLLNVMLFGVATVTATDDCDQDVTVTFSEVITNGSCADNYVITRTWVAIDNCANASTLIQKITVEDNTPPVLTTIPADITANCDGGNIPSIPTITATDNCDNNVTVSFVETQIDGSCPNSFTLIRTWTATDNCGNTVTGKQQISVGDTTPPEFDRDPADLTVECDAVPGKSRLSNGQL
ncbi:MAG: hypothetical protein IPJ06_05375 [Saprospiraceae bacterium]|nr:hypothetical protein [Saprospiraceae bacterium]